MVIQLVDEQIWSNPIVEGCQKDFIVHLIYQQGFPIKATNESMQTLVFSLFYVQ